MLMRMQEKGAPGILLLGTEEAPTMKESIDVSQEIKNT